MRRSRSSRGARARATQSSEFAHEPLDILASPADDKVVGLGHKKFHALVHEVRRARGDNADVRPIGTVLTLVDQPLFKELRQDTLDVVALADAGEKRRPPPDESYAALLDDQELVLKTGSARARTTARPALGCAGRTPLPELATFFWPSAQRQPGAGNAEARLRAGDGCRSDACGDVSWRVRRAAPKQRRWRLPVERLRLRGGFRQ